MRLYRNLFWLSCVLLVLGAFLPLMTVSKFVFVNSTYSLVTGIFELLLSGQVFIFVIVFIFSLVLPLIKMYFLHQVIFDRTKEEGKSRRNIKLMHDYGRWSMLDVMVVAVLIVASKLGALASVEVHFGLYCFAASVLLAMFITHKVSSLATPNDIS